MLRVWRLALLLYSVGAGYQQHGDSSWLRQTMSKVDSFCTRQHEMAAPMQYSIPTHKWKAYSKLRSGTTRSLDFAPLIPGDPRTYNYTEERSYLEMYASALFCITKKKGGWDCMRHYEILLAGCVPFFMDLESLPAHTMVVFPRHLITALMQLPGVPSQAALHRSLEAGVMPSIDHSVFPLVQYMALRTAMLQYVEDNMLCSHRAKDLGVLQPQVLLHSRSGTVSPVDYMRDLLLIGLVELGVHVHTTFNASYVFEDFDVSSQEALWVSTYGRAFLYEQGLPKEAKRFVTILAPGDAPPEQNIAYVKTTHDNRPFPQKDILSRGADIFVDANDIWASHPEPSGAGRWFRRELADCQDLTEAAKTLLAVLDSGVLWDCASSPSSHLCPDLRDAARIWQHGLESSRKLSAYQAGWKDEDTLQTFIGDIADFLQTPTFVPDFVDRYLLASNTTSSQMSALAFGTDCLSGRSTPS